MFGPKPNRGIRDQKQAISRVIRIALHYALRVWFLHPGCVLDRVHKGFGHFVPSYGRTGIIPRKEVISRSRESWLPLWKHPISLMRTHLILSPAFRPLDQAKDLVLTTRPDHLQIPRPFRFGVDQQRKSGWTHCRVERRSWRRAHQGWDSSQTCALTYLHSWRRWKQAWRSWRVPPREASPSSWRVVSEKT